jgi:hypothetical protein
MHMPKFHLRDVGDQVEKTRYYPTLVNGQDIRASAVFRLFDTTALAWGVSMLRLGFFVTCLYLFVYLFLTSSILGYTAFSFMLRGETLVLSVLEVMTNFILGFFLLAVYSLL